MDECKPLPAGLQAHGQLPPRHPRATRRGHHGHQRLLEEAEAALAAPEPPVVAHQRRYALVVALRSRSAGSRVSMRSVR